MIFDPLMITDSPVPFSGGTSLEGNFSAPYGGVSLDITYMDQIVDFHEAEYGPLPMCSKLVVCIRPDMFQY